MPDGRERHFSGVTDGDDQHLMSRGEPAQRSGPVGLVEEVRDDHDQSATLGDAVDPIERSGQVGAVAGRCLPTRRRINGSQCRHDATPVVPGWNSYELIAAGDQDVQPVATARGQDAECCEHGEGDLALFPTSSAKVQARRPVDDDRRFEFPVGLGGPYLRVERARGQIPIDPPRVVGRFVPPSTRALGARPRRPGEIVAGDQAVEPTVDLEFEAAKDGRRLQEILPAAPTGVRSYGDGVLTRRDPRRENPRAQHLHHVIGRARSARWRRS